MAKFELTIDPQYVPAWGTWSGVREMLQNALDGHDQGYEMNVYYKGGFLVVQNKGLRLDRKVLLLGNSTKAGVNHMRGEWGEGMKLGLLALLRAQVEVFVVNGGEKWTPVIAHSEVFNAELLTISTRKQRKPERDFSVFIGISEEQWDEYKGKFLCFCDDLEHVGDTHGRILLGEDMRGKVFAHGIFVRHYEDLAYGYDFRNLSLDRDRKMADEYDLKCKMESAWKTHVLNSAVEETETIKRLKKDAFDLLADNNSRDLRSLGPHMSYDYTNKAPVSASMAVAFHEKYGEDARPVKTQSEAEKLEHAGLTGVVVQAPLADVLGHHFGTVETMYQKAIKCTGTIIPAWELDEDEKRRLDRAFKLVMFALPEMDMQQIEARVRVYQFLDDDLEGLFQPCDDGSYMIKIARRCLSSSIDALKIMVHEFAHVRGMDGMFGHDKKVESMWASVTSAVLAKTGMDWIDEL
jgi:hypothetical protein